MYKEQLRAKAWESTVRKAQQQQQQQDHQQQQQQQVRRRVSIFTPMSVAPADDADGSASTTSSSSDDHPGGGAGAGAESECRHYLWTDGCMYEGDWRHGKATGKGKFSWPSGATYEGEFKAGFMDGHGTYTGAAGDTYRGGWLMNLKHGAGNKSYANGDYYDGEWRNGLQDGAGRYVWRNGTEYAGQWRAGLIHGKGSLIWANGNRYDGGWEDGAPRGNGSFRWADGSLYVGIWSGDGQQQQQQQQQQQPQQKGVYYPSPAASSPTARDPREAFAADLPECKVCAGEAVSILPSQKALNWSGDEPEFAQKQALWRSKVAELGTGNGPRPRRRASVDAPGAGDGGVGGIIGGGHGRIAGMNNSVGGGEKGFERICIWESDGDITCDIVDGGSVVAAAAAAAAAAAGGGGGGKEGPEDLIGGLGLEEAETRGLGDGCRCGGCCRGCRRGRGRPSPRGTRITSSCSICSSGSGKQGPITLDLKASAFDPKEKVWTKFPPEGTKYTPPHQSCDFRWKDYCPLVFRTLRKLFKVDAADYMMSLCGNDALRELSSPGKSGSFFYLTNDDKYMIKTMKKSEVKVLLRMLPAYYNHVRAFEDTLVTKFFGLHCVRLTGAAQKKVRFVIMGNLFCSEYAIHRRFDLKGSSHGRMTDKPETEIDEYTTLKDLDLNFIFRLQRPWFQDFQRQVDRDCEFLEQERIMDYSLLVGVHFRDTRNPHVPEGTNDADGTRQTTPRLSRVDMDQFLYDPNRWVTIRLGTNMPARAELTVRRNDYDCQLIGESTGEFYDVVLYFGIIDILQDYDISKKLEHAYKSIQYDPTSISAVDPKQYSKRFRDFIFKAFAEDT
uniref:1-phosphatidylinositol-4-phosphate 5-kinase n=1 Tax=Ananas comosus var. bracteatus TaxID=296719 RepID=A0A6V7PRY6_ANACO|nr:unnamed protein product [Ananas comosus var. bracteatus]